MKNSILQAAINNWPEDEAFLLLSDWAELSENGYSEDSITKIKAKDICRMESIFDNKTDLMRFRARLNKGL